MLRRVSSSFFGLIRTPSEPLYRPSVNLDDHDAPALSPQTASKSQSGHDNTVVPERSSIVVDDKEEDAERDAFAQTLEIIKASGEDELLVDLPYSFDDTLTINADGLLRANVDIGLLEGQTNFHVGLRREPAVAKRVTRLELAIHSSNEDEEAQKADEEEKETERAVTPHGVALQKEGLLEWARTVPALANLKEFKLTQLPAKGDNPPKQETTVEASSEKALVDPSMLLKSLAWFGAGLGRLEQVSLEGVKSSDVAARAWEVSSVKSLTLKDCSVQTASLIGRLRSLQEVVIEDATCTDASEYLRLLDLVKFNLQSITLILPSSPIDLDTFIKTFSTYSPLHSIDCTFTCIDTDETEQKLRKAFPKYHPEPDHADTEMGVLEPSSSSSTTRSSPRKRTATMEKRKEELKIAEAAGATMKNKTSRVASTIRRLRAVARGSSEK